MTYSSNDIAIILGTKAVGNADIAVRWLLTDSRSLSSPEDSAFFALTTPRNDGHRYISQLYQRGARCFVVSQLPEERPEDAVFIEVPNTLQALQKLVAHHRQQFQIPIIGVTGSNGKTMVKEWLAQMLSPDYNVTRSPRSFNSQIGVPLSVWSLNEDSEIGIFEAAISMPGEMEHLAAIIQPTLGIFTGLGDAHQENFDSYKQKCLEKLRLFRHAKVLVYPAGNRVVDICIREIGFQGTLLPIDAKSLDMWELDKELCVALCRHLGMSEEVLSQRRAQLEPIPMRLEVMNGQGGCTLINDSYNNDPDSLRIALDFLQRRFADNEQRRTLILSDMQQTGIPDNELYLQVATLVREHGIDHFIGVGSHICAHAATLHRESGALCHFFPDTAELLSSQAFADLKDEVILIKGARTFHFEDLVAQLEEQVHETILEVDLKALVSNLNHYRSFLQPGVRMVCMVKADAYGAGSIEVARTLQDQGVDYLAVAVADEGAELRKAGISTGIMIMNPEMTSFRTLFRHNLEPEVYSFRLLEALIQSAEREGIKGFPVHIKLDTGMHRLGFDPLSDMPQLVKRLKSQKAVLPRSVFSHFVGSDSPKFDQFSAMQYERFLTGANALQEAFPQHHILRHMCNSAGIEHFPERQMDMVRLGLGLYGISPLNNRMLYNVSTLKTTILQIHDVPRTETVGYSRRGQLKRDSRIAVLPIGYADGLNRHLGNGHAYCLVNGQQAPYVGNICMDVCMIDVTDIACKEGDTAIIFGRQLPVTQLSDTIDTIPYEILTSVSNRVKRVYFRK